MSDQKPTPMTEEAADSGNYPAAAGAAPQVDECIWNQTENAIFLPVEKKTKLSSSSGSKRVKFSSSGNKRGEEEGGTSSKTQQFEVATAAPIDHTSSDPDVVVEGGRDALSGQTALAEEDERLATHPFLQFFLDEIAENHYIIKRINSPKFVAFTTLLLVTSCVAVAGQVHNSTTPYHWSVFVHLLTGVVVGCLGFGYYNIATECQKVIKESSSEQPKYQELFRLARLGERFQLFIVIAFYPALAFSAVAFRSCELPSIETDTWEKLQCSLPIFGVTIFLQCIPLLIFRMRVILCLPLIALPAVIYHVSRSIIVGTEESSAYQSAKFLVEGSQTLVFMMVAWVVEKFHRKRFVAWIAYRRSERLATVYRESLNSILELLLPPQCLKQLVMNQPAIDVAENSTISVCQVNDFCVWSTQVMPLVAVEVMDRVWSSFDLILHKNPEWRRRIRRLVATGDQFVCCLGLRESGTGHGDTPAASSNSPTAGLIDQSPTASAKLNVKESTRGIVQFAIEQRRTIRHFLRSDAVSAMVQPFQATVALATGHSVGAIMGTDRLVYGVQGPALKTANKLARLAAHGTVLADPTTTARGGPLRTRPFTATNSSISESLVRQMRHCSVIVGLAAAEETSSPTKSEETRLLASSPNDAVSPARSASPRQDRSITPQRDSTTPWSTAGTDQPGITSQDPSSRRVSSLDQETVSNSSSLQEFVQFQQQRGIGLNPDARQAAQMRLQELTFGTQRMKPDSWYDYTFVSQRMEEDMWKFAITHANVVKLSFDYLLWIVAYAGVLVACGTDESMSWYGLFILVLSALWAFVGRGIILRRWIFGVVEKELAQQEKRNQDSDDQQQKSPNGSLTGTTALRPAPNSPKSSPSSPYASVTRHSDKISGSNSNKDIFCSKPGVKKEVNSSSPDDGSENKDSLKQKGGDSPPEEKTGCPGTLANSSAGGGSQKNLPTYDHQPLTTLQKDVVPQTLMKTITAFIVTKDNIKGKQEFNYNQQLFIRPAAMLVQMTLFAIALAIGTANPWHTSPRSSTIFEQQQKNEESDLLRKLENSSGKGAFTDSIVGTSFQFEFLLCSFLMYWHVTGEYVWYHGSTVMFIGATIVSITYLSAAYWWGSEDAFYGLLMQLPLGWAALPVFFSALFQRERERRNSFCDSAFTEANFAIAEAELEINRALMKILLPKFVVEAVLKKQRGAIYNSVVHSLQEAIALEVRLPAFSNSSVLAGAEMVRRNSTGQLAALRDSFNSSGLGLSSGALLSSAHGTSVTRGGKNTQTEISKFVDSVAGRKSQAELSEDTEGKGNGGSENSREDIEQPSSTQQIDLLLEKALLSFNLVESALKWATERDEAAGLASSPGLGADGGDMASSAFIDTTNADLTILHVIGDSVMLAGPLIPPPKQESPKPDKTDRCVLRDGADAKDKEKKQAAAGDIAVVKSAIAALKVLVWLENQVPGQITGVCVNAVGYASVVGRNHPTFALMGGAPRLASALTSASPIGFLGATEAFLTLLHNHGVDLSLLRIALGLRQSWRIRGSGITGVRPLRIAVGDEEVLPHEDPTILAVTAAIEEARSGTASGSQVSLGDGSILFSSGTGRRDGVVSSVSDVSFSPPARPLTAPGSGTGGSSSQDHTSTSEAMSSQEIQFNYCPKSSTPTNGSFAPIPTKSTHPDETPPSAAAGANQTNALFPPHPQQVRHQPTAVEPPIPVSYLFPAHPARIVDADGNAFQIPAAPQHAQHPPQSHQQQPQQVLNPHSSPPARQIPLEAFSSSSTRFPMGPKLQSIPKWRANPRAAPALVGNSAVFPPHPAQDGNLPTFQQVAGGGRGSNLFPAHPPQNSNPSHQVNQPTNTSLFPPHSVPGPSIMSPPKAVARPAAGSGAINTLSRGDEDGGSSVFPSHPPRAYKSGSLAPLEQQNSVVPPMVEEKNK